MESRPALYPSEGLYPSEDLFPSEGFEESPAEEAEEGSRLWEVLYQAVGFHRDRDGETGFQLKEAFKALMTPLQRVYDLIRERPGQAAGSTMLDPAAAPLQGLRYLAQYVGGRLFPNMDEAQQRAEIEQPTTWRRGQDPSIELVAKRELTGDQWISIRPRTPGPGQIYIRTLLSETPNPDRLEAELLEHGVPAWDLLDYEAIGGVTVLDVASSAKWTTVADLAAAWSSVEALTAILPSEL